MKIRDSRLYQDTFYDLPAHERTRKQVAEAAGVSEDTVRKVEIIEQEAMRMEQTKRRVWYYGRLVEERCPTCESPMPFFPKCYRCGYGEDETPCDDGLDEDQGRDTGGGAIEPAEKVDPPYTLKT